MILFSIFVIIVFAAIVALVIGLREKIFSKPGEFGVYTKLSTSQCNNGTILTSYWCNPTSSGSGCLNSEGNQSFDILIKSQKCTSSSSVPKTSSSVSSIVPPLPFSATTESRGLEISSDKFRSILSVPIRYASSLPPHKKGECISDAKCLQPSLENKGKRKVFRKLGENETVNLSYSSSVVIGGNASEITLLNGITFKKIEGGKYYSHDGGVTLFSQKEIEEIKNTIIETEEECIPTLPYCGIGMKCCSFPKYTSGCITPNSLDFERGRLKYEREFDGISTGEMCDCECILLSPTTKKFYLISEDGKIGVGNGISSTPIKYYQKEKYNQILSTFASNADDKIFSFERGEFLTSDEEREFSSYLKVFL